VVSGQLNEEVRTLLFVWAGEAGLGQAEQQRMHQRHQRTQAPPRSRSAVPRQDALKRAAALLEAHA